MASVSASRLNAEITRVYAAGGCCATVFEGAYSGGVYIAPGMYPIDKKDVHSKTFVIGQRLLVQIDGAPVKEGKFPVAIPVSERLVYVPPALRRGVLSPQPSAVVEKKEASKRNRHRKPRPGFPAVIQYVSARAIFAILQTPGAERVFIPSREHRLLNGMTINPLFALVQGQLVFVKVTEAGKPPKRLPVAIIASLVEPLPAPV